jgi:hypothetical protein
MVLYENDNASEIQIVFVHTNIMLWLRFGMNDGLFINSVCEILLKLRFVPFNLLSIMSDFQNFGRYF